MSCAACTRPLDQRAPGQHGRLSKYCPPCRASRKLERRRTQRQRTPYTRKARVAPPLTPLTLYAPHCRCALPAPRTEDVLLVCGLCTRVVADPQ